MSLALHIKANGLDQTTAMLQILPKVADEEKNKAIQKGGQIVAKFWKLRLSGPAGPSRLGVRSGQLRRSIRSRMVDKETAAVGSMLPYSSARIHEFGYHGPQQVSAHRVRAHSRLGKPVKAHTRRSFVREMRMPARPHRAPAERDSSGSLLKLVNGSVEEAIRESKTRGKRLQAAQRRLGRQLGASARRGKP